MKNLFGKIALCVLLALTNALGKEITPRMEMQQQLLLAFKKDIANGLVKSDEDAQITWSGITDVLSEMGSGAVSDAQINQFDSHNISEVFPESTEALMKEFRAMLIKEIESEKEKYHKEFTGATRGYLIRALSADNVDEVAKVEKEWPAFLAEIKTRDKFLQLRGLPSGEWFQELGRLFGCLNDFHISKNEQSWYTVGKRFDELDKYQIHTKNYLSAEEYAGYLAKLRDSVGIVLLKDFEEFYQNNLNQLLDDANQDRIEDILANMRKQRLLCDHANSNRDQRCGQMISLGVSLNEAIQRVREGAKPQLSIESWSRSDSATPPAAAKDQLVAALGQYRIKVKADDGEVTEVRLYYPVSELKQLAAAILDELLDDANQDRLEEIHERAQSLQGFVGSSSEFIGVSQRYQQIVSLALSLRQMVNSVKRDTMPRVNVDELLSDRSEHNNLLEKKQLTDILKAYKVKVIGKNGQVREEFLYQEASDVIARINQLSDIDGQLRALTMVSQSSYDDGLGNLAQALLVLTQLAVIHRNLENGASFTLVNQPYHGGDDWGVRGAGLNEGSVIERKVEVLRNEAERAVLARCFPGKEIDEGGDRDEMIAELLKKLIEEKDYQKVLLLGRLASYFAPKKSLFPTHEILAMQHYLDGVRQLEELSEPRLATGNFQQAAALRSSIIPVADLTQRLHQLKKEQPAEYEQGTSDALKPERAGIAPISQQLMMQTPLLIPER